MHSLLYILLEKSRGTSLHLLSVRASGGEIPRQMSHCLTDEVWTGWTDGVTFSNGLLGSRRRRDASQRRSYV